MVEWFVFDGIAPTYNFTNAGIVVGFELLTLLLECGIFYLAFRNHLKHEVLMNALAIILLANAASFVLGAGIYTAINGYEWLYTSWATTPILDLAVFLNITLIVPIIATAIALLLITEGENQNGK